VLDIPAGSTGRIVKAKPVAKVENRPIKSSVHVKKDAPKVKTERSRVRTKKFKES
jgi:hypothetical protein